MSTALSSYGLPLGEAFQLRDDVLGVFGDPGETGKPAGDDLREGKRTVLVAATLTRADAERGGDRPHVTSATPASTPTDVEVLREIIAATGALAEVERMIAERDGRAPSRRSAHPVSTPAPSASSPSSPRSPPRAAPEHLDEHRSSPGADLGLPAPGLVQPDGHRRLEQLDPVPRPAVGRRPVA